MAVGGEPLQRLVAVPFGKMELPLQLLLRTGIVVLHKGLHGRSQLKQ